jgi:hypothetical protein
MTNEEIEQTKQYEWEKFCERYPAITGRNLLSKIWLLFKKDTAFAIWENGFLRGWLIGKGGTIDETE